MAAKSLVEVAERSLMKTCLGMPLEKVLKGELRDFLAHEVARFCKKHDAMKHYDILAQFTQEVVKDIPAVPNDNK